MSILRKLKNKIVDDLIPNELKSPEGAIAAAVLAADQFGIPGTDIGGNKRVTGTIADVLFGTKKPVDPSSETPVYERSGGITGAVKDVLGTKIGTGENEKTLGSTLLSGILSPAGLSIGAGLLAGAFAKDKEDPLYTGQSVGLNLRDIRKLANISDPRTGAAIGLNFLPETRFRQFSPEQMAETFAATAPRDFTEDRTPAQEGGIMGDQKDFEQFLQDMKERDMGRMQDQILRDFENYMKRKKMIESLPEAKNGGIMKAKPKMAGYGYNEAMADTYDSYLDMKKNGLIPPTMTFDEFLQEVVPEMSKKKSMKRTMAAKGGMMDMGGMEMDLRGGGFVPMGREEKADDVPARLSKNEFVFTADAVRAAGGGNIDKGADKMYATMKALENKVA
jgi:hypothetical protein